MNHKFFRNTRVAFDNGITRVKGTVEDADNKHVIVRFDEGKAMFFTPRRDGTWKPLGVRKANGLERI